MTGGAFDDHHPPSAELVGDCVHCGFCLPTCPTYVLWGEEMDSPRGRIYLMKQGLEGEPMTDSMVRHFDACLGCMACVTACPSGRAVRQADRGTPAPRSSGATARPPATGLLRGAIFALFPYPRRLRLLRGPLRLYQAQRAAAAAAAHRAARPAARRRWPRWRRSRRRLGTARAAARADRRPRGERRAVVGMLTGCVQGAFFPGVNAATARVLAAEGCDVVVPRGAGLLRRAVGAQRPRGGGAAASPAALDRRLRGGRRRARRRQRGRLRLDDEGVRRPAAPTTRRTPSGRAAFAGQVRDVTEFLDELGPGRRRGTRCRVTVAYHDACHLGARPGRPGPAARAAARRSPGWSCGRSPSPSSAAARPASTTCSTPSRPRELGDRKAANVVATGAELLVTANPGCLMQVAVRARAARASRSALAHTVEVLDASIRGLSAVEHAASQRRAVRPTARHRRRGDSMFQQVLDPVGDSLALSALCARCPAAHAVRAARRAADEGLGGRR